MSFLMSAIAAVVLSSSASQPAAETEDPFAFLDETTEWIKFDPENIIVMDLPSGTIYIELNDVLAPGHVDRVRKLTREGFYNGTIFHRVIDGFMAQGGDPTGTGQGGSQLPDLEPEFASYMDDIEAHYIGRDDRAAQIGFVGTVPVGTQAPTLNSFLDTANVALWGLHCQGVMSMARATEVNSANSQFFLMFGDSRDGLDQGYTVWGRVVSGYKNARRINRGEPPTRPTPIVRMRVLADMPAEEKVDIEYLDPKSDAFATYLDVTRQLTDDGYVRDVCSIFVPVRIDGEFKK